MSRVSRMRAALLARARDYPYRIPQGSYVYRDAGPEPFDPRLTRARTPVLAIGSNQAPERLAQKFGHDASHVIPVQRARLAGFDVVYSAHISSYGAVPAMLQRSPGAAVTVAVTWLDEAQLEIMHESEMASANYRFAELEGVHIDLAGTASRCRALAYVSSRGHLSHDGAPLALAAIACEGRRFRAVTTAQALEQVRARLSPEMDADDFVERLVEDAAFRRHATETIARDAGPFDHPLRVLR